MCKTNTIKGLFTSVVGNNKTIITTISRSDGQMFRASINLLTEDEATKVKDFVQLIDELRTCECRDRIICEKHRR